MKDLEPQIKGLNPRWWELFTLLTEFNNSEKLNNMDWCHISRQLSCYIKDEHLDAVLKQLKEDYKNQ